MSEENKALATNLIEEVMNNGNFDRIDELMSPDFVEHEELPPGIPQGPDAPRAMFGMMLSAFPDFHSQINMTLADGDMVVIHQTWTGTHEGDFMGIPPTGNSFSINTIDIMEIIDGQITGHWGVTDMAALMEQLGLMG